LPSVTVIVATYNRAPRLLHLLDSLSRQDVSASDFEVIVVDDGSTDETPRLLAASTWPYKLNVIRQANGGPGAARNAAIRAARTELIISLDDDVTPAPDLVRKHMEAHAAGQPLAAIGVMLPPPEKRLSPWLEWEARALQKQYDAMLAGLWQTSPRQFYTANASLRRSDALRAGLFDETFRRNEDVEFAFRLEDIGVRFEFLPDSVVYHDPARPYAAWLRMARQYGRYDVILWRDKGRSHLIALTGELAAERHKALKLAAHLLIGRDRLLAAFTAFAGLGGRVASLLRMPAYHLAYGAIFNLQYWQGLYEELGDSDEFWAVFEGRAQAPPKAEASAAALGQTHS
jgi:glycosyltransferase involved in cell wall biosynthesis